MNDGKSLYDIEVNLLRFIRKCQKNVVYLYKLQNITKMEIKKESGIYCIKNIINNKCYVGQSKNVNRRFIHHKSMLRKGLHCNSYLQRSFNKYGEDNFIFIVLEYCSVDKLTNREKYHLSTQNEYYNLRDVVDSVIHPKRKYSKEVAEKVSKALKGKIPKNLDSIQKAKRKKVAYYLNNVLIEVFDSCMIGANYFNIKPNIFNLYIGRKYKKDKIRKSKHFGINYKLEYYE